MTYIKITRNYYINNFEKKVVKEIIKSVKKTNIYENYNNVYYTQKYTLKQIITFILIKIKYSLTWEGLGKYKSNIHKHFIRFCKYNIFTNTYEELITKYIISNKSKYIYTDTTTIINKGGIDNIKKINIIIIKIVIKLAFLQIIKMFLLILIFMQEIFMIAKFYTKK